ncbi:20154_t:CDS:2 [Racocetra fulgida]|uniref:20154_t:CDS:1 n=1 Tax=Racocetra fulgida TaxID=60492 RepID=A0A9N9AYB1_9GLOM|nr:20154_t:CDS:2 [Racocetra fulgida]
MGWLKKHIEILHSDEKVISAFKHLEENIKRSQISNDLCEDEKKFVHDRKFYIREAFAKYVGVEVDEIHPDDIPIIALTGSGGGFSIIDAVKVFNALADTSAPQGAVELAFGGLVQKKDSGIHLSLVDIYGALLGAKLLIGHDPTIQSLDFKMSSQKKYVEGGKKPLPLYAAIYNNRPWKDYLEPEYAALIPDYEQVLERHKMKNGYFQWYEFTPFEFGCEEFPGDLLGSSPAGTLKFDLREFEMTLPDGIKSEFGKISKEVQDKLGEHEKDVFERIHLIPPTNNHNYSYHLYPPPYELGINSLRNLPILDPAPSNELPMYPLTNPSRKIDIIVGFNSARQVIEHELFDEQQIEFCKRRGYDRIARDISNKHCEIYDYIPNGKATGHNLQATNPTVFCHMPFLKNDKVDPTFEPLNANFTNTANFVYTTEQVNLMFNVAKQN